MPRPEKVAAVKEIADRLQRGQGVVLADYRGLDVGEMTELRRLLRATGVELKVVKNTLAAHAGSQAGIDGFDALLTGPTAIAFGYDDPVAAARVLSQFGKAHADLQLKGGVLEGRVIGVDEVSSLAALPPREVLLAQVLAGMQAPIAGLVFVLQGTIRQLVYALDAVRQKREAQPEQG